MENWLLYGNLRLTAEVVGVGYSTIKAWKTQPWWSDVEREIQAGFKIKQNSAISQIVEKGLDVVKDRLENGDVVLDQKTGELVRRPVALRDATGAVSSLMQRQGVLEKQLSEDVSTNQTQTIQEQLSFLATEFAKFNNRSTADATDIAFVEVVDADERVVVESGKSGEMEPLSTDELLEEDGETNESFSFGQHTGT